LDWMLFKIGMNGVPSEESVARVASVMYGMPANKGDHGSAADSRAAAHHADQKVGFTGGDQQGYRRLIEAKKSFH